MELFANNLSTTLASPAADTDTVITLTDATGWPSPSGGDFHRASLIEVDGDGAEVSWEIVLVTGRSGNDLTVTRAQEGTAAVNWLAGTLVQLRVTAAAIGVIADAAEAAVEAADEAVTDAGTALAAATGALAILDTTGETTGHALLVGTPGDPPAFGPVAGGGGGSLGWPHTPPETPSAYDDEFEAGTLNAKWVANEVYTAAGFTVVPNRFGTVLSAGGPGAASGVVHASWFQDIGAACALGTQFSVTCKMGFSAKINAAAGCGVLLYLLQTNSLGSGDRYDIYLNPGSGTTWQVQTRVNGSAAVSHSYASNLSGIYVHLQKSTGNVLEWWYSLDGFAWWRSHSVSVTQNLQYLCLRSIGIAVASNPTVGMFDWVRCNHLWLPV